MNSGPPSMPSSGSPRSSSSGCSARSTPSKRTTCATSSGRAAICSRSSTTSWIFRRSMRDEWSSSGAALGSPSRSASWSCTAERSRSRARPARAARSRLRCRNHDPDPPRRRQRKEHEARAGPARVQRAHRLRSHDRRSGCGDGNEGAARPRPDGHSAPGHRRHRGAAPDPRRRQGLAHPRGRVDRLRDGRRSRALRQSRLRRIPREAHRRQDVQRPSHAAHREGTRMSDRPARILAVDDKPENIRLLEAVLAPSGYEVIAASSGDEAIVKVREQTPDLILTDIVMPGMTGYELCRRLRADPATAFLPIVTLTASGGEEKREALDAGADDFVAKPFDKTELLARVRSLLRIKRYYDDLNDALDRQTAIGDVLRTIGSSAFDIEPALQSLAQHGDRLCGAENVVIWRTTGTGSRLWVA